MEKQDKILDKVAMKTHVSKEDIFSLANDLQSRDLRNENDIREFVLKISKLTNKNVSQAQMDKIISVIKNDQIPHDLDHLV